MSDQPKPSELDIVAGGRLITTYSDDNVGPANYVRKLNMRRIERDRDGRREGWIKFKPNAGAPLGTQSLNDSSRQTLLVETIRPNGERVVVAAAKTVIRKFDFATLTWIQIGSGFSSAALRWQWCTLNGYLILNNGVDLPVSYRVEEATVVPLYELREAGIASAKFITQANGFLLLAYIKEIKSTEQTAIMNGTTPYGIITDPTKVNDVPWEIINGEYGQPRMWAPEFSVVMNAASANIVLPWTSTVFVANTTRVAVLDGGPNGGVLGGQSDSPEGVLVTGVAGSTLTLAKSTDATLTYPRTVTVMRWSDQSTLVGKYPLQDDSSPIVAFKTLNNQPIAYRSTRIFVGRYTATPGAPFDFKRRYEGEDVPKWAEAVVDVNGKYHLYPGEGGRFYSFDGIGPQVNVHRTCDDARNLLFDGVTPGSDIWAIDNPLTKEIWFCRPGKIMAYDYFFDSVSEIDAEIHAAAFVQRPNSTDKWFILAIEGYIFTYGLVKTAQVEILTWLRDSPAPVQIIGPAPAPLVKFGLAALGSAMYEKDISTYILKLGNDTLDSTVELKLWSTRDAHETPTLLFTDAQAGPTYKWDVFYRDVYFQDQLRVTSETDRDFQLVGRIIDKSVIRSHGVTRSP